MATVSELDVKERAKQLRARTWTKIGFDTNEPDFTQRYDALIEQALLAERRLAKLEDAEIADKMAAACQERAQSLESFSPGHEAWGAAQLDILANALRAAAEKEVQK